MLTVLLMIAVAVTASIVSYSWTMTYLDDTLRRTGHTIQISSVNFLSGDGTVFTGMTIYVQNVRDGIVQVTDIYVDGAMVSADLITMSNDGLIDPGETCIIDVIDQSFIHGTEIAIKVVCSDGVSTENVYEVRE